MTLRLRLESTDASEMFSSLKTSKLEITNVNGDFAEKKSSRVKKISELFSSFFQV